MRRSAAGSLALATVLACAGLTHVALAGTDGETPAKAPAHVEKTFLIPSSDGYGVGECLTTSGSACGQVATATPTLTRLRSPPDRPDRPASRPPMR